MVVAFARGPFPLYASGEHTIEEQGVGCSEDAGERMIVDRAVVERIISPDKFFQDALVLAVGRGEAFAVEVLFYPARGFRVGAG